MTTIPENYMPGHLLCVAFHHVTGTTLTVAVIGLLGTMVEQDLLQQYPTLRPTTEEIAHYIAETLRSCAGEDDEELGGEGDPGYPRL